MKKRRQFRRGLSLFCLLALLAAPAVPAAAAEQPDRWAQAEVAQAVEPGLVPADLQNGYGKDITRAEFCRLAVLCLEETSRPAGTSVLTIPAPPRCLPPPGLASSAATARALFCRTTVLPGRRPP